MGDFPPSQVSECGSLGPHFPPLTRQRRGMRRDKSRRWGFYIFGAPNQPGEVRTPSPAGGKAAPLVIPSELFQPDPETAIDAVARLSVVRRHGQVIARRYGKFPEGDLNEAARAADATRA